MLRLFTVASARQLIRPTCLHGLKTSRSALSQIRALQTTCIVERQNLSEKRVIPIVGSKKRGAYIPKTRQEALRIVQARLSAFDRLPIIRRRCSTIGLSNSEFSRLARNFMAEINANRIHGCSMHSLVQIMLNDGIESVDNALIPNFYTYVESSVPTESLDKINRLRQLSDLRRPTEWHVGARATRRRIIMHVGPTNSGKTYNAMQRLQNAENGVYCGPLRLLAHEVYERFNTSGHLCNLITGEDRRIRDDVYVPLTSLAVVDEIQMIADPLRGWAWTHALLGLQAKEVHLCGEATAVNLVKRICETLNEEVEINEYQRLSPLELSKTSLNNSLKNIRKGDCVVTFSRENIFALKQEIESQTGHRCAVIYGALPPETRAEQARLFNNPDSGYDVLVASDAIGMGLNLNIRRIIFESMEKFDGKLVRPLQISQVKQIAGRAGRFQTAYAIGEATTLQKSDLGKLHRAMNTPQDDLKVSNKLDNFYGWSAPTVGTIEQFAHQLPNIPYYQLLEQFEDLAKLDGRYFMCNFRDAKVGNTNAERIEDLELLLPDRYLFCVAPANVRDPILMNHFTRWFASAFSENTAAHIADFVNLPERAPSTKEALRPLESQHRVILLYIWLSYHYPDTFVDVDHARELKRVCEQMIDEGLTKIKFLRKGIASERGARGNARSTNETNTNKVRLPKGGAYKAATNSSI
ncbi:P-loop containing nucleoside triphosphate hydrolase protein [Syncephalis fuscata]|nr:P-loop containing nucleoside triphosphate hydrolase protein [Syncephalis fuscata]